MSDYNDFIPNKDKTALTEGSTRLKNLILETYNSEQMKLKLTPIIITKSRSDNYIIRTENMPLWESIRKPVDDMYKRSLGQFHLTYILTEPELYDNIYGFTNSLMGEKSSDSFNNK